MTAAVDTRAAQRALEQQLRRVVARRVDALDVDDVVQDVFVRLQRGAALRAEDRFDAWLLRVARSAVADHRRARARHPLTDGDAAEPGLEPTPGDGEPSAADQELAACIPVFVAMLPPAYREALTLTELQGMTQKDAAALLGVSWSGMKSRVQRGRQRLRELFDGCCAIAVDARGNITDYEPRVCGAGCRNG